jgi:hypothetical protein
MAILSTKKTVTGVTAKLAKVAQELRAIEVQAKAEAEQAAATLGAAAAEAAAAGNVAGNIEKLLGQ